MGSSLKDELAAIPQNRPIPVMPSQLFQELALSQLEFLASALASTQRPGSSKVKSMALYLPQENVVTGQLEFTPIVLYPRRDRVFIAPEADSGVAPTLPTSLTKLPGFSHAKALIPRYPMVSSPSSVEESLDGFPMDGTVGLVEEVLCDLQSRGACALSVPLFSGLQTLGVLLVSPADIPQDPNDSVWSKEDRQQVARAARSLSLALNMDQENQAVLTQNVEIAQALSDSLHQVKNPLQALRTYGKLLQQQIAQEEAEVPTPSYIRGGNASSQRRLLELADHMMVQSDRLSQRLEPVDSMVERLSASKIRPALLPAKPQQPPSSTLIPRPTPLLPPKEQSNAPSMAGSNTLLGQSETDHIYSTNQRLSTFYQEPQTPISADSYISTQDDAHELELEMAFVPDVLEPIFDAFRAIAQDRQILFRVYDESDELPGVHIHPQSVQEVVSNIIDNAFKYVMFQKDDATNFNPSPQVRVFLLPNDEEEEEDGVGVTIIVTDNGPGIPDCDASGPIFERGYRIHSTKDRAPGQGLGLSIAHSLAEAMGGHLNVVYGERKQHLQRILGGNLLPGATMEIILYRK